jgi:hypothetical protein
VVLEVHAEDGDKGSPRELRYGIVSEGNPFVSFFNIDQKTGNVTFSSSLHSSSYNSSSIYSMVSFIYWAYVSCAIPRKVLLRNKLIKSINKI